MLDNLLKSLPDTFSMIDRETITRAYRIAEKAHAGQNRASGEAYITHCGAVGIILAELGVPPTVIIAGLLHDTIEDKGLTLDDIRREFGDEVTKLVDGVTKLTHIPQMQRDDSLDDEPEQAEDENLAIPASADRSRKKDIRIETLRKTFLAMGEDIRVILIKLADRLHNMRTLGYMPEVKRKRIAQETLDILAPLANRLGIWQIKWELEDLSFRYVDPEKYKEIATKLSDRLKDRESQVQTIITRLKTIMEQSGIKCDISGRPKHIYSIYKKMIEKGKPFEAVRDLRGVRLIVADIPACYAALGVIHTRFRPIPQEFDDYIAAPKSNMYQSLHTAVIYTDGKPLEVQIRTYEMHQSAEYGIAAHWRYKEKGKQDKVYEDQVNWLRKLMEWRKEVEDAQDYIDGVQTDVFRDRVYVFTPKGDIIDLPSGSTPIDFAYHVHTEIGNRCRGAKVNGKLVTLDYTLITGDQVEILTAKHGGPSRDWLNSALGLVKTQRSRSKVRQWFKYQDREQNLTQGKAIIERELHRLGLTEIDFEKLRSDFALKTIEDFYVAIGSGDITLGKIINHLVDFAPKKETVLEPQIPAHPSEDHGSVSVLGLKGLLTTFGRCCNPAPGDDIVGYITRGRGATIHRQDCPNILRLVDRERVVKVSWGDPHRTYPVSIQIKSYDRQGLLGDISTILSNESISLVDLSANVVQNIADIRLILEVSDISQLSRVLSRIENLPNVLEAFRSKPG
jgi:guanosine-3',5'-bis(diphosphate) 3'-pyrophosphohydrolase